MTEILVILVVAMLFLGPEKLPEAAKQLSKGIRDLRKQTKEFQDTIENDTQIGGAIRDLKSALRGDDLRRPPVRKPPPAEVPAATAAAVLAAAEGVAALEPADGSAGLAPAAPDTAPAADPAPEGAAPDEAPAAIASADPPGGPAPEPTGDAAAAGDEREPEEPSVAVIDDELATMIRPVAGAVRRGQPN